MEIRYRALSHDGGAELEEQAARSTFWELPPATRPTDPEFDKQMWIQSVLYRWGICGYTAYVSTGDVGSVERPAATVFFAPGGYFPGVGALPSGPVSSDAVLVSTVFVDQPYMGLYLEHSLIETVMTEAERRGVKAVEAFGRNDADAAPGGIDGPDGPTGPGAYTPEGYRGWEERPPVTSPTWRVLRCFQRTSSSRRGSPSSAGTRGSRGTAGRSSRGRRCSARRRRTPTPCSTMSGHCRRCSAGRGGDTGRRRYRRSSSSSSLKV